MRRMGTRRLRKKRMTHRVSTMKLLGQELTRSQRACQTYLCINKDRTNSMTGLNNSLIRATTRPIIRGLASLLILDKAIMSMFKRSRSIALICQLSNSTKECNHLNSLRLGIRTLASLAKDQSTVHPNSNSRGTTHTNPTSSRKCSTTHTKIRIRTLQTTAFNR